MIMTADFEEQPKQQFDIARYMDLVRRRHVYFLVPLLFGWLLVWGASWVLPARYLSSVVILVEQPSMPKNYVVPNVDDDLQARLVSISQQILSRTRLLSIVDKLHLYSDKRHRRTPDEEVAMMRSDIHTDLVHDPSTNAITAFTVAYSAPNPYLAQQVTKELTSLFIGENQKEIEQESQNTTNFISNQLEDARANLADQEAKVRAFEAAHEGELPDQETSNLQILSGLQQQMQNEQDALNTAKQQRIYDQSVIEQYRSLHAASSQGSGASPTEASALDEQLIKLRSQLADLSTRYTDQYPAVQNLKEEIAKTEKMRDQEVADLRARANAAKQSKATGSTNDLTDGIQNGPLLQLEGQLRANQTEITNREQAIAGLNAKINNYQARLNAEPASEQQLADLTRGYEQSKANYDDLLKKENESAMATSMEKLQQGERFTMLDAPTLPQKPDFPNRLKFCGAGFAFGIVLGAIVVGGLELNDDRLHSDKEILDLLPVAVIAEVPQVLDARDESRNRRRVLLGWAMAIFVFMSILVGSAFSFLHA
jgi:succinoglycan biosynthesis transport protein ExoP